MIVTSLSKISDVLLLLLDQRLVDMLAKMAKKSELDLSFKRLMFIDDSHEILPLDRETSHLSLGPIDEAVSLRVADVKPSNIGTHPAEYLVELPIIDFKPHFIIALFDK